MTFSSTKNLLLVAGLTATLMMPTVSEARNANANGNGNGNGNRNSNGNGNSSNNGNGNGNGGGASSTESATETPGTSQTRSTPASTAAPNTPAPAYDGVPDSLFLEGKVRDFLASHPDFESYPNTYNKPSAALDADGKPTLDLDYYDLMKGTAGQSVDSPASFAQWWRDDETEAVSKTLKHTIELEQIGDTGVYRYAREGSDQFFPIDGEGWGTTSDPEDGQSLRWQRGGVHNYHFTYEVSTIFTYTEPRVRDLDNDGRTGEPYLGPDNPGDALFFQFTGDDDVFVYINGQLVVDLGGVHQSQSAGVNVDDEASRLGLVNNGNYELKLFFAERHTADSNFKIETSIQLATDSSAHYD